MKTDITSEELKESRVKKNEELVKSEDDITKQFETIQKVKEGLKNNITGFATPINSEVPDITNKIYTIEEVGRIYGVDIKTLCKIVPPDVPIGKISKEASKIINSATCCCSSLLSKTIIWSPIFT